MQEIRLKLSKRDIHGKKAKKLTEDGQVLGNVYGKGQDSQSVSGDYRTVVSVIEEAGKTHPIELEIEGGKDELALVSEIERNPMNGRVHHISFQVVHRGQKVSTEVPIRLIGEAPAEKVGMIVVTLMDLIEIEAIPSKIPESFEVDMAPLQDEGDSISLRALSVPEGVELKVEDLDLLIAKVDVPRAEVEEEEEEAEDIDAADVPSEHGGEDSEEGESSEANDESKEDKQE